MPEKFEGGVPPQEKGEKVQAPEVAKHLSFIREVSLKYRDLTGEGQTKIEQSFNEAFERLSNEEQKAVSLELQALNIEIGLLNKQNHGVGIVRQTEIVNRVGEIMDRSGVVASAKEGGVERIKEQTAEVAEKTAAYLTEYEAFAQSVKGKSKDTKQTAEYLLAIVSGIKQELERLKLADVASAQPQNELRNERESRHILVTSISEFGRKLDRDIEWDGLIGFSTLNKLIKEFYSAKKYLEESVLQAEVEE